MSDKVSELINQRIDPKPFFPSHSFQGGDESSPDQSAPRTVDPLLLQGGRGLRRLHKVRQ